MDLIPYLSAIVLITTIATIILALISYAGFKLRGKRRPNGRGRDEGPVFFRVYSESDGLDLCEGDIIIVDRQHASEK